MGALTLCLLLKLPPEKLERRFVYEVFFSSEVALYFYKSAIWPCMEYCFIICIGAPIYHLNMLYKLQKREFTTAGLSFAAYLEPLAHLRNVAILSLFYGY